MVFQIDEARYRIIDLSLAVSPPGDEARPFRAEPGKLGDGALKHDVTTHTHVGTHIEAPVHAFEGGRMLEDYPLSSFYGRAVLFEFAGIECEEIDGAKLEADIGAIMGEGDIVAFRNTHPEWRRMHAEDRKRLPYLCADGARWHGDVRRVRASLGRGDQAQEDDAGRDRVPVLPLRALHGPRTRAHTRERKTLTRSS